MYPTFYPVENTTLYIPFGSYNSAGASVALTGLAVVDIEIYKDGSVTQRASDNGYTLLDTDGIDFDGVTGINGFSLDLSDNTTAGFYAVGSQYFVVISAVTIDSQTVNFIAAWFEIVSATRRLAGTALPAAAADAAGGLVISDDGGFDIDSLKEATHLAAVADALLNRDMSTGTDSGSTTVRTPRQALRMLRNKVSRSGTTLTVTKEDDSTASFTATLTTDAAAEPITVIDPAGP